MCSECEVVFHEKAEATRGVISLIICSKKKPPRRAVDETNIICGEGI